MEKRIKSKMSKELIVGIILLSCYLFWVLAWFVYSHFIYGTIAEPFAPALSISNELLPPFDQKGFIFGTDVFGRSLLEVMSAGLSYSLILAFSITFINVIAGVIIGYFSSHSKGLTKYVTEMLTNMIFVFPHFLIALMVMSVTGQSLKGLVLTLIVTGWPSYARLARGEIFRIKGLSFVEAAYALGATKKKIFFSIIVPELFAIMSINFILGLSGVIVTEAALGFLGLGGSEYSWGVLLAYAKNNLLEAPHVTVILSLALCGLIIALNLVGDGLRDYLDPKTRYKRMKH